MGLSFRKSIRLIPGVRLNVGLRRSSLSFGGKGFTYNVGTNGPPRLTVGIPGSGLSYSTTVQHQAPAAFVANALPTRRRYSATPFVIVAFVLGLVYILSRPQPGPGSSSLSPTSVVETTGSLAQSSPDQYSAIEGPVPLPRPRPKLRTDSIGPPLQLAPPQQ
ncbi:DUF4236 domain-containing protein [Bradyrhizobium diazoefficiens]|uniref:DUF4236 domain-containing protein n=1 Tax=Bradyrhizobium diazoefficiens TaxID=1355477 RepID=A0A809YUL0_9BRAD|nr:DUF4236 domain-containing protein [Bradyrhizobium diazoefficiens]WLC15656.1 DUF4236 domain-containing protein [Bradyrhizobium diazoefficiens]BCA07774.1 hypothetical protein H12S4_86780 [Bradyrhizobium diazoefficiens]BCA25128.1 hypothetical protein BDHH15_83430 [Bradyrhizobium diazoefficiens]BCE43277.1 hypothetical protein XF3B_83080 [Bradyrhizobium diazoefficiens]BCE78202.1 hypothetical protein XF8B_83130 [Bradyrhizobium diazoefficiens]